MKAVAHTRRGNGRIAKRSAKARPSRERRIEELSAKLGLALREHKQTLEQQAATAEILQAMSRSPGDPQPIFKAIVENAHRLCNAAYSVLYSYDGALIRILAHRDINPKLMEKLVLRRFPQQPDRQKLLGRVILDGKVFHTADIINDKRFPASNRIIPRRAIVGVPLMRNGAVLGAILCGRAEPRAFSRKEMWLLKTFADQAVIAIENARLFNETKEALEQQTATADILKVISSSPTDVQPVLDAVAESAARLCQSEDVVIRRVDADGLRLVAHFRPPGASAAPEVRPLVPTSLSGRAVLERRGIHVENMEEEAREGNYDAVNRDGERRTMLAMPLLRENAAIGVILIRRKEVRPYSDKQIALLKTFADQAAIAIENVRLFNETKESLERQTATAEILRVISQSPTDTQPVFDAIVASAVRLCAAKFGALLRVEGDMISMGAYHNPSATPEVHQAVATRFPAPLSEHSLVALAARTGTIMHSPDVTTDPRAAHHPVTRVSGIRGQLTVPLIREGRVTGVLNVVRDTPGLFSETQIAMLKTFADQAVIAIENVRLFNETKEALERQTATAGILSVIAASPSDVQPVFETIAEDALKLCGATFSLVTKFDGELIHIAAARNLEPKAAEKIREAFPARPSQRGVTSRCILTREVIHIPDITQDPEYSPSGLAETAKIRSILAVPMLRHGEAVGAIAVSRRDTGVFPEHKVALLKTFADQAVIAIDNVRLFGELQARNKELTEALEQRTATGEILNVISRSTTDIQPVFDTIIRNAVKLGDGAFGLLLRYDGTNLDMVSHYNFDPHAEEVFRSAWRQQPPSRDAPAGRAILQRAIQNIPDVLASDYSDAAKERARSTGYRALISVPLMHNDMPVGAINVGRRDPGPFADSYVDLLKTFADQAVIAIENVRLFNETKEALERQTATAEILKVISGSPTDVQPVFDAIVQSAARLFGRNAALRLVEGNQLRRRAHSWTDGEFHGAEVLPIDRDTLVGQAVLDGKAVQVVDTAAPDAPPYARANWARLNYRSNAAAPLMRDGSAIGVIAVSAKEPGALSDKQMALLSTFADQAVIAIENARLFNETKEALQRQTATAEILKVISRSPTDVKPVLNAVAERSATLCAATNASVFLADGQVLRRVATFGSHGGIGDEYPLSRTLLTGRAFLERQTISVEDIVPLLDSQYPGARTSQERFGFRSAASIPLLRDDRAIGVIMVWRNQVHAFSAEQIALLQTFADQAVIAIENVRLFNETKEALERQTATSEVLRVISGTPADAQPVFQAIAESAARVFNATHTGVGLVEGGSVRLKATAGRVDPRGDMLIPFDRTSSTGCALFDKAIVDVADTEAPDALPFARESGRVVGFRAIASAPMLREGRGVGVISVMRAQPGALTDKQRELLQTFADQAVIAIENARLFNETREALERQTATAEILKVISSSPTDVQPVFDAIIRSAVQLCGGMSGNLQRFDGKVVHLVAHHNLPHEGLEVYRRMFPRPLSRDTVAGCAMLDRAVINVPDARDPAVPPHSRELAEASGFRSVLVVPLLHKGEPIGVISVARAQPGPFAETYVEILKTFADQAVIAIENVRLFNETKEALEQQTAISEVLRVISNSPADVQPVLDAVASRAARICEALDSRIFLVESGGLRHVAGFGEVPIVTKLGDSLPLSRGLVIGRAVLDRAPVHIEDIQAASRDDMPEARQFAASSGWRTVLAVPLLRESQALGAIALRRMEKRSFSEKQIALLRTFADQAAIAIENVRLFNEIKEALEQQTATGDILKVISGSQIDVQPVFDAIVASAVRLTGALYAAVLRYDGERLHFVAHHNYPQAQLEQMQKAFPRPPDRSTLSGRAVLTGEVQIVEDVEQDPEYAKAIVKGRRTIAVPMMREGTAQGAIAVAWAEPGPAPDKVVQLLRTFGDQAAIAMENVRLFREIQEKSAQLEVANKHKSEFLASMSHELRTPLNALLGFNEMILGGIYGEVPGDMLPPLAQMHASGKHLLRLINNVLDLAKIEAGRMELALAEYSVHDTVESVRSTLRPLAADKGLALVANVPADLPIAYGDPGRITQCLMNLAGNSLKFTKAGKVEISVVLDDGRLRYSVADTGIGIPADKMASLFTEFKQTDATVASEYGGTGLGLSISRKFVEMHGGRIWAESEPGHGSTFIFEIPLRVVEAQPA